MVRVKSLHSHGIGTGYRNAYLLAVVAFMIQSLVGLVMLLGGEIGGAFLALAGICMAIMLAPYCLNLVRPDPFDPLTLASVAVLLGTGLRIPYILFSDHERARFLLFDQNLEDLVGSSAIILLGILCFTVGYCCTTRKFVIGRLSRRRDFTVSKKKLVYSTLIFGGLGMLAFFLFLSSAGIDLSGGLASSSRKVFLRHETASGDVVAGAGALRFLMKAAEVCFVALVCFVIARKIRPRSIVLVTLAALSVPVFLAPFITSSRSSIALVIIAIAAFAHYYGKLRRGHILAVVLVLVAVVTVMGGLRAQNMSGTQIDESPIDSIIGSGNGLDFVRTAAIVDKVPAETDYLLGRSYVSVFTFFIPRSIWPGKPDVALGPFVKEEIFGYPVPGNNGWPAGTIAEAYLNFGIIGVPAIMFLYGLCCRIFYNSFREHLGKNVALTLLYSYIAWRLGVSMFGLNLAHGVSQVLILAIPMVLFLYSVRGKPARRIPIPSRLGANQVLGN